MKKEDIKALLLALSLIVFESFLYYICKLSPFKATVLTSSFDEKLPFIAAFCLLYSLWFIYLLLIPFVIYKHDKKVLFKYTSIAAISIVIAFFVFLFYPTTIVRDVSLNGVNPIFRLILRVIYFMDTPNLCCLPSMHCALCYIFIYTILRTKNLKWYYKVLFVVTSLGIVASTMFIKQHVIWDVLAAIPLVVISIIIDRFTPLSKFIEDKYEKIDFGNRK